MKTILNETKKRIDLYDSTGEHVGEIEFMPSAASHSEICATHTEVFKGNEGKGYAGMLLDALVAYAVEHGYTIKPVCSYVVAQFKKDPEKYAKVIG